MTDSTAPGTWSQFPHRRYNPLRRQWVLVSPHRTQRPWQGEVSEPDTAPAIHYDPKCYLCPGNTRAGGHKNPDYNGVFAFDNDYAALLPDTPEFPDAPQDDLLRAERERGICRVVCFHPDHDLTLARMQPADVERVVAAWAEQSRELGGRSEIRYVQIFENRGAMMGASNPHPHCQIWATEHIPDEPQSELLTQREYYSQHGHCLLCDYLEREIQMAQRIVCENEAFVALVPFWAVWPFETMILSCRHIAGLNDMTEVEQAAFADILRRLTTRYDNLFEARFPYTMGLHPAPTDDPTQAKTRLEWATREQTYPEWHFHAHFYPPLLRSATVRKFMVGFEMLGMPQRDITPESAADRLRSLSEMHYSVKNLSHSSQNPG